MTDSPSKKTKFAGMYKTILDAACLPTAGWYASLTFPVDGSIFGVPLAPAFAYKPLLALKDHFARPAR
ncbi:MAG: hypothetical protein ACT6U0_24845 [Shinella sp.]|uniref:hypothetical protein n=1 Tax=Shinella sp. TaxID=1870904 RepID=UPI0040367D14